MKPVHYSAVTFALTLAAATGCDKPPVPARTEPTGPPKVVLVNPKSEEGQALAKALLANHENIWVSAEESKPLATVNPAAHPPAVPPATTPAPAPPAVTPNPPTPPPATPVPANPTTQPAVQGTPAAPATPPATPAAAAPAGPGPGGPAPGSGQKIIAASESGLKGKQYGAIGYALNARVTVGERLKSFQIQQGLQVFVVQNERPPRDLDEFTEQILKPANVKLPELPAGDAYYFDPKQKPHGELMIWRSQPAP